MGALKDSDSNSNSVSNSEEDATAPATRADEEMKARTAGKSFGSFGTSASSTI
eukprot:Awhi_evm1s14640